jgi:hypothetical protein
MQRQQSGRSTLRRVALTGTLFVALMSCSSDNPLSRVQGEGKPSVLAQLSVQQPDVPDTFTVTVFPGGARVQDEVTLDLCGASYPSERLRVARRQVGVVDGQQRLVLSTEAVAYRSGADTAQAFSELRAARASCPAGFRSSPGSAETFKTTFNPPPDTSWAPPPAGVERLGFDFVLTDEEGNTWPGAAVYLRRGRILLSVYLFRQPDSPMPEVDGQTTLDGIVGVFATRLSQLPANIVA